MTPQTVPRPQGTGRSGVTSGGGGGGGFVALDGSGGAVGVVEWKDLEEEEEEAASTISTSTSTTLSPITGSSFALSPPSPALEPSKNPSECTAWRSCDLSRFSRRRGGGKSGSDANGDRRDNAAADDDDDQGEAIPFRLLGREGGFHRTSAAPVRAENDAAEPYDVEAREEEESRRSQSGVTAAVATPNNAGIALFCSGAARRKKM